MAHPVGDAASVLELARVFRREAKHVGDLQTAAEHRAKAAHWVGQRATRTRAGIRAQRGPVGSSSNELTRMAKVLEEHAAWIRKTIAELEGLERRIRAWAAANPPNPETPGPDASWIRVYPGRHSFTWRDLARQLQTAGARF